MKKKLISMLLLPALLAACSSDDDNGDTSSEPDPGSSAGQTSMLAPGSDPSDAPQPLTQYNGSYLSGCVADEEEEGVWLLSEVVIVDDTVRSIDTEFSDAACTRPGNVFDNTFSVVYPGGMADTSLGTADFADFTIETGTTNGEDSPVSGITLFDLILLDGATLYFGQQTDELDATSIETRPTEIDASVPFTRL